MGRARKKAKTKAPASWRYPIFWRNLLFYFLFFPFIGHYVEMAWVLFCHFVLRTDLAHNILASPFEPYTIYGTGAVLAILIVKPLAKKFDHNLLATFVIATLVCTLLELFSSIIMTIRYGYNPYWDYHNRMFNLDGHICLANSLLFGLLATVFLRLIYPFTEKVFRKQSNQITINIILFILIVISLIYYLHP